MFRFFLGTFFVMDDLGILALTLTSLVPYVIGSIPTAVLVVKRFAGKNVMAFGTGNVGTLNTLRATNSKLLTISVLFGDMSKGAIALLVGYLVSQWFGHDPGLPMTIAGISSVVGHNYSIFLKLKGGKGLATSVPILLYLEPTLFGVWIATFLITVAVTRLMVGGQIAGTVIAPIVGAIFFHESIIPVVILAAIVFVKHAPRLKTILKGTEPRMYYRIRSSDN